jgi:hypothetical protein
MDKQQNMEIYNSLDLYDIKTIESLSNDLNTFGVGVGDNDITIFNIEQIPPEVECEFKKEDYDYGFTHILVEFNTSRCKLNNYK